MTDKHILERAENIVNSMIDDRLGIRQVAQALLDSEKRVKELEAAIESTLNDVRELKKLQDIRPQDERW